MPFSIRKLTKLHLLALCSVALFCLVGFSLGLPAWLRGSNANAPTPQPLSIQTREAANNPQGVIQLLLRPEGFDSPKLTVVKGTYILILLNRTGEKNLALQVSRVVGNGEKTKDIAFDEEHKKHQIIDSIDLTPGDYIVSVQSHPEWTSRITATNK